MNKKVLFRVDGNANIGLGHLVRCFALANILKENFEVNFFCKEIPNSFKQNLINNSIDCFNISNDEIFFDKINKESIVVLDGYYFNDHYKKSIKNKGCKLVSINDFIEKDIYSDVIINHNPGIDTEIFPKAFDKQILALGAEYSLLRTSFLEQSLFDKKKNNNNSIMICFGGSDPLNLTYKTLEKITQIYNLTNINIVIGSEYKLSDKLLTKINKDKRIVLYKNLSEKDILNVILESDFAVISASSVFLEVIACGTTPIICYYSDNQKLFHDYMVNTWGICSFSENGNFDFDKIIKILQNKACLNVNLSILKNKISKSKNNLINLFMNL